MDKIKIDVNWQYSMEILIAVLEQGSDDGKKAAKEKLRRLAQLVDEMNEKNKVNPKSIICK